MQKIIVPSLFICCLFYLVSCKKDDTVNPPANNLIGNYKFISLDALTTSTVVIFDGTTTEKIITRSAYTSKNNTGSLTIGETTMTSTDIAFQVDTTAIADFYEDGILTDTQEVPFAAVVPASSATSEYKLVSSDSLYFPTGSVFYSGVTTASAPAGSHFRKEGDKIYFTGNKTQVTHNDQPGISMTVTDNASVIATYQKQ